MYQISIDENLKRIFVTNKLTKTLRPDFGLSRFIDEKADLFKILELKNEILTQIKNYEPRIELNNIDFDTSLGQITTILTYTDENNKEQSTRIRL